MKQKALKTVMTWQKWSPSSTRFKAGIFLLLLVGPEHPILLILLSHRLELSLSGWIRKKFTMKTWHNPWRVWCARPSFSWSPPTSRRGGSISISIPEIAFSFIFSETGEFPLYLQECYLGRRISWLRSTWIYSFCVPHPPMLKHAPIPQWKEMLLRDQKRKRVPRQKDLVCRVEAFPQDIAFLLLSLESSGFPLLSETVHSAGLWV